MSTTDNEREALIDTLGPFIETRLFRDLNIPKINALLHQMVDAILAAGFHRQGPVTDEQVETSALVMAATDIPGAKWEGFTEKTRNRYRIRARAALEAARNA